MGGGRRQCRREGLAAAGGIDPWPSRRWGSAFPSSLCHAGVVDHHAWNKNFIDYQSIFRPPPSVLPLPLSLFLSHCPSLLLGGRVGGLGGGRRRCCHIPAAGGRQVQQQHITHALTRHSSPPPFLPAAAAARRLQRAAPLPGSSNTLLAAVDS